MRTFWGQHPLLYEKWPTAFHRSCFLKSPNITILENQLSNTWTRTHSNHSQGQTETEHVSSLYPVFYSSNPRLQDTNIVYIVCNFKLAQWVLRLKVWKHCFKWFLWCLYLSDMGFIERLIIWKKKKLNTTHSEWPTYFFCQKNRKEDKYRTCLKYDTIYALSSHRSQCISV